MTPARVLRPEGKGRFVLLCDHASNRIPIELGNLGLPKSELIRHIAWDIGAAGVTEALSGLLDAPAILCETSRLVIDCNRQLDSAALIPAVSDGIAVPGNSFLSDESRNFRIQQWFQPYHDTVDSIIVERAAHRIETIVVAVHSMTPRFEGQLRPWQIALSSYADRRLTDAVLAALRAPGDLVVGDNEPFRIEPDLDYSVPFHAMRRRLQHLQVEFRQDEITDAVEQRRWASRFADALLECT